MTKIKYPQTEGVIVHTENEINILINNKKMETVLDKIKHIAQTANSGTNILTDEMLEEVMPKVIEAINKQASQIGYDGFTYNRPSHEYPEMMYFLLWENPIRQVVLDYLEENHPMAWFKPMYFTTEKQREIGMLK
jgi:hypothetical protein